MGLILASPKYTIKLNDITIPRNVKVVAPNFPNRDLTLIGNPAAIKSVMNDLQQLQALMCKDIDQAILRVDPKHVPFLESREFVYFCKIIQNELFVYCSHRYWKVNATIENPFIIRPTPLSHCIKFEVVKGSLVNEHAIVDAIVNNATDGTTKLIVDTGGPSIQLDYDNYVKSHGKLMPGKVVCFGGQSLLCRKLIHVV